MLGWRRPAGSSLTGRGGETTGCLDCVDGYLLLAAGTWCLERSSRGFWWSWALLSLDLQEAMDFMVRLVSGVFMRLGGSCTLALMIMTACEIQDGL